MRWGYYAARIGLVLVLLAAAAALPTSHGAGDRLRYREGEIARERIVAPYDFSIHKDDATMRREQEEAALAVLPVYVADAKAQTEVLERWAAFQESALKLVSDPSVSPAERVEKLKALGVPLPADAIEALAAPGRARRCLGSLTGWMGEVLRSGVVAEKKGGFILGYRTVN